MNPLDGEIIPTKLILQSLRKKLMGRILSHSFSRNSGMWVRSIR